MISEHRAKECLAQTKERLKRDPNNMNFRIVEATLKFVLGYSIMEDTQYFEVEKSKNKEEIKK